ncbi:MULTISPECIES: hypothetical protein [unclassified Caulobacter]|jgi:hypothetical protein|uniref:hypothetical protein n=1 Tax=unclassified Caulobacter TaxID=2648921 RepID=UPI0006F8837B|nr:MULTISPECIES: hypothetical protein [unclassified Caulobacter]KQV58697.1 hypothetical protein ASC62_07945 [Caulobacter sp. Root342]KQV68794.1 hypothetical protein ASC70_08090 [Caulobacter sp. Root343]
MSQDGYTAAEALAALAILGLAIGGLTSGLMLIGRHQGQAQAALNDVERRRAMESQLTLALSTGGIFRSDDANGLRGDSRTMDFPCAGGRCAARLEGASLVLEDAGGERTTRLPTTADLRFEYLTASNASAIWPPTPRPPPAPAWEPLRAVVVRKSSSSSDEPVALARLWLQQKPACEYDLISQDCRGAP